MFQSRSPRYPVRFDAVIDDGDRSLSAPVTNLSETGLFLETTTGLKAGARVRIIPLTQEAGGLSEFEGEVVRTQDPVKTGGVKRAPGIAIRFVHLLPPDKARLQKFCRKTLCGPTANDDKDDERSTRRMPSQAKANASKRTPSAKRQPKAFKNPAKATEVDALVDLTADAALVDEQPIEATAVTPKVKTSESEAEFFAKGESFADREPVKVEAGGFVAQKNNIEGFNTHFFDNLRIDVFVVLDEQVEVGLILDIAIVIHCGRIDLEIVGGTSDLDLAKTCFYSIVDQFGCCLLAFKTSADRLVR
mgnify:CR=1 FL=1